MAPFCITIVNMYMYLSRPPRLQEEHAFLLQSDQTDQFEEDYRQILIHVKT
ncbi:hypothetical protein IC006_1023 [Sulfuracidifex tepidarius]|uniref:Uncharacterized protein n=1 Tax=Sulfuracidifex tepidarius TaxID=1294262 RepID=A0A510E1X5_9CREN|nr:hypothetical protein IC006_1023 [Sulfuracidifex tepidarius]BBG26486.1 hypothetical protein IC007_0997 [Sulfuracidifex tepidarius]